MVAQVVSTCRPRIRGVLHDSIGKAARGYYERAASNQATDCDEQIRVPHVLKNMGHPAFRIGSAQLFALSVLQLP